MGRSIKLIGLDCGSTTTSAVVASARLTTSGVGRVEVTHLEPTFQAEKVFTPFDGDRIDAARLSDYLDDWLLQASSRTDELFGGGALVTGLAAQRANAQAVTQLIESRLADSVVATADDPGLESWLAFMGNCQAISQAHPLARILNLDIGGGTTNLALGIDGQVIATGCLFVGARHFQFTPGTYHVTHLSPYANELVEHLGIDCRVGYTLSGDALDAILDFYVGLLEATVRSDATSPASAIERRHIQVPLHAPTSIAAPWAIMLSGGVGQLVYDRRAGMNALGTTQFGDLGGELATRIADNKYLADRLASWTPQRLGLATVYGLLQHSMELSGSTIYLPDPARLPLKNVPIVGTIGPASIDEQLDRLLDLAARCAPAGAIRTDLKKQDLAAVRELGERLARGLVARPFPRDRTLVLLVPGNLGKVLGNYVTRWNTLAVNLIAIDEVASHEARFVRLGQMQEGVVPLWLYGRG